jgi:hypothetical protein
LPPTVDKSDRLRDGGIEITAGRQALGYGDFGSAPLRLYCTWSKEFMEGGKRCMPGDTARAATTGEVQNLRREARALKKCVAAGLKSQD